MNGSTTTRATAARRAAVALVVAAALAAGCFGKKKYDEIRYYRSVQRELSGVTHGVDEITRKQAGTESHWRFYITAGRPERMEHYDDAGKLASEVRLAFDAQGGLTEERTYAPDKKLETKLEITYDETGRAVGFRHFTADAGLTEERLRRYDEQGRLAEVRVTGPSGILRWRDEMVYGGQQPSKWLGVRRYDRQGKLIEQIRAEDYSFWD